MKYHFGFFDRVFFVINMFCFSLKFEIKMAQKKKFAILKVSSKVSAKSKCRKFGNLRGKCALYKFAATVHWLG